VAEPSDVQRRLVAVFAADVEGYSHLMGADEVGTMQALANRRRIIDASIEAHRGRIANTAGRWRLTLVGCGRHDEGSGVAAL
jgi:adenylate cyclase